MKNETVITMKQFKKLLDYLSDDKRDGSFRYLIYDVMGFEADAYCDLYNAGLMIMLKILKEEIKMEGEIQRCVVGCAHAELKLGEPHCRYLNESLLRVGAEFIMDEDCLHKE